MDSGHHQALYELLEVKKASGIADWLKNHENIDINNKIHGKTMLYHFLEQHDIRPKALEELLKIPGIKLERTGKQQDIPIVHYIKSYGNGTRISNRAVDVIKLLIGITDKAEPALVMCLKRRLFRFAKEFLETDGIDAHIQVGGNRTGIITLLLKNHYHEQMNKFNLPPSATFDTVGHTWDEEIEELYQLLFHKQLDINDNQINVDPLFNKKLPLFHILVSIDVKNINKFDKLKAICAREDLNPNAVGGSTDLDTALMAVLKQLEFVETASDRKSLRKLVDLLMKNKKLDVNLTDRTGSTALMITTDLYVQQLLLKHDKIDINIINKCGYTKLRALLEVAQITGDEVLSSIMQHPMYDVNRVYTDGTTDLIWALYNPGVSCVSLLLKCDKVDVSLRATNGKNPMCSAAKFWDFKIMKLLTEHPSYDKGMLNVIDKEHGSFLHYLCMANHYHTVNDSDLQFVQDKAGFTPLMRAIKNYHNPNIADIVHYFFSHPDKCDLSKKNKYGQKALQILEHTKNVDSRAQSLVLGYANQNVKAVKEFSIADHIQSIQMKISESGLTSKQKEQLQFMLKSFEGVFESLSSGGKLDSNPAVRKILMDNYWYILENIEVGELIERLFSKAVITENELELIRAKKTRMYKASKLMEILLCRGERCYEVFIQSLIDTYQGHIVDEINRPKSSPSTEVVPYEPHDITIPVPFKRRKTLAAVTFKFDASD